MPAVLTSHAAKTSLQLSSLIQQSPPSAALVGLHVHWILTWHQHVIIKSLTSETMLCRVFQQQFCQAGKPVLVSHIQNKFFWDPDTLQRATLDLKGMYGKRADKGARKVKSKDARPLTVSLA